VRALAPLIAGCCALAALGLGVAWAFSAGAPAPRAVDSASTTPLTSLSSQDGTLPASSSDVGTAGVDVEVPSVEGKTVRVAEALITAAGLTVQTRVSETDGFAVVAEAVLKQWPAAGVHIESGSVVTLTYQPQIGRASTGRRFVVVVDAGHQAKPDLALEPESPGSKLLKPKVSAGAVGVSSGAKESAESLAISLHLRDVLRAVGVDVVMVRTSENVDISNSERARIGNKAQADLVVRVHQSSSSDGSQAGVTTFFPSGTASVAPIESPSRAAALRLEDAVVRMTGAKRVGIAGRGDLSGFNYSQVPTVMVECGYLSNPAEDVRMATAAYRTKLANGIAAGVLVYLRSL
jgi:N-acetylmuramoyl-L-alanine amidase